MTQAALPTYIHRIFTLCRTRLPQSLTCVRSPSHPPGSRYECGAEPDGLARQSEPGAVMCNRIADSDAGEGVCLLFDDLGSRQF